MQSKSSKKSKPQTTKRKVNLLFVAIAIAMILVILSTLLTMLLVSNEKPNTTDANRHIFTKTEFVGGSFGSYYCSQIDFNGKSYCVEGWSKVYDAMDATSNQLSHTMGNSITIEFDASYRIGDKEYSDFMRHGPSKIIPTIFIDKVYSASAKTADVRGL